MNKLFLLLALLLAFLLAAVGLQPDVLKEGYKAGMYDKEVTQGKTYLTKYVTTPVQDYLKGGPDQNLQSGELTDEEKAELEAIKNEERRHRARGDRQSR